MTVGMMVPVTLPAVRHVGLNSLRSRRWRAMTVYVAVYVAVWIVFGIVALTGEWTAREIAGLDGRILLALALIMAAIWQLTRIKRRAIFACRRTVPLPPVGRRADAGCARFALLQGWRCVVSCWALMLVMLMAGHAALTWMMMLTALILVEELTRVGWRLLRPSAAALAFAAGLVVLGI
jgi:predicted metal-binding membrane protein